MKQITARFNSVCAEIGKKLKRGDLIIYDYSTRKAYHLEAPEARQRYQQASEAESVRSYVRAQEEAYFDNRYRY